MDASRKINPTANDIQPGRGSHLGLRATRDSERATRRALMPVSEPLEQRVLMTAWYVAPWGDNTNYPGTLAKPFETIQRAANIAQPGDIVYIRGGVYHETVTPTHSGTAAAPIVYEPYNGESVTLDGADRITGLTQYRNAIYSAPQPWDLGEGNNQVFVDGRMINEARWPNTGVDVSHPTWATASSVQQNYLAPMGGTSIVTLHNSALHIAPGALNGALVHLAAGVEWVDQVGVVIASSAGAIKVSYRQETASQIPVTNNRFYVVGTFQSLDGPGEWYRDPTSHKLYLWDAAGDNATHHTVEAKARQYGFDLSGLSHIIVADIGLFACTINTDAATNSILLDHLNVQYASHSIGITPDTLDPWNSQTHAHNSGVILNGHNNVLQNSTIANSSGDGVFLGGYANTVQNCIIHDVDYEAGDEAAITTMGSNESVLSNTIYNAGRSGIVTRFTTASHILHNAIYSIGLQMTDLGGIYTWGTNGAGTEIAYNLVSGIHTAGYGACRHLSG